LHCEYADTLLSREKQHCDISATKRSTGKRLALQLSHEIFFIFPNSQQNLTTDKTIHYAWLHKKSAGKNLRIVS
jgi:hypothetical protein